MLHSKMYRSTRRQAANSAYSWTASYCAVRRGQIWGATYRLYASSRLADAVVLLTASALEHFRIHACCRGWNVAVQPRNYSTTIPIHSIDRFSPSPGTATPERSVGCFLGLCSRVGGQKTAAASSACTVALIVLPTHRIVLPKIVRSFVGVQNGTLNSRGIHCGRGR
jgi:hypothetical protein